MKTIYNGTNHEIKFFSPNDCARDRAGNYFLRNGQAIPVRVEQQDRPLSIHSNHYEYRVSNTSPHCFLPDAVSSQIDCMMQFYDYDMIIVSSRYARTVTQRLVDFHRDYVDRLFTLIPVYASAQEIESNRRNPVGAVGVEKAIILRSPDEYVQLLQNGIPVSRSAMEMCIGKHQLQRDYTSAGALNFLQQWLQKFNVHQEVRQTKQFNL